MKWHVSCSLGGRHQRGKTSEINSADGEMAKVGFIHYQQVSESGEGGGGLIDQK